MDFKSGCFLVKTSTVAVWQRLLLTKQCWDFSREATDSEFLKLLSPALKPERGAEINICIFILLLQFSNGALQAGGWFLLCTLGVCWWEVSIIYQMWDFEPSSNREVVNWGAAELIRHSPSPRPCHGCSPRVTPNPIPNPTLLGPTGRAGGRAPADNISSGGYLEKPANPSNTRCFLQKRFYIHIKTSRRDFLILMNFSMK